MFIQANILHLLHAGYNSALNFMSSGLIHTYIISAIVSSLCGCMFFEIYTAWDQILIIFILSTTFVASIHLIQLTDAKEF